MEHEGATIKLVFFQLTSCALNWSWSSLFGLEFFYFFEFDWSGNKSNVSVPTVTRISSRVLGRCLFGATALSGT